ncbi:hypothetical protein [Streptomyces antimycoticus]|uniref:hypothetical protein n=1 Tax=Streptomyces antimycoticus TaxID=68175 RepID=UPI000A3C4CEA|nr:hypothetical protein [Streptomyces antimycoticus]
MEFVEVFACLGQAFFADPLLAFGVAGGVHQDPAHYHCRIPFAWSGQDVGVLQHAAGLAPVGWGVLVPGWGVVHDGGRIEVDREERKGKGASDHAPVVDLEF